MPKQAEGIIQVVAHRKYVRVSPRKARRVAQTIKGKLALQALNMLLLMPQKPARYYAKLLKQAIGNAVNDYQLNEEKLVVVNALADNGPMLKRFRPRARGRVYMVRKRMAHLTVIISPKEEE
ncbi:MAG: 50S ribosomal protein L22 [Armatimonadetes bacterium]|nr:50S ribosomal protein L22 [Armatimonadota bacterium]